MNTVLVCIFKVIYLMLPSSKLVLKYKIQALFSNGTVLRLKYKVKVNLELKMQIIGANILSTT